MRILIVNDDGIKAPGIRKLAELSVQLGEVWVVAPKKQCSAMSQRITLFEDIEVTPEHYDVENVRAYSVGGTPADCVKVALEFLMPEKPDVVFSGINRGYNAGVDILYSGTVGAAMEALANGIRAIAFSNRSNGNWETVDEYFISLVKELLNEKLSMDHIWNVNFPGCTLSECKGILRDRIPANHQFYQDAYVRTDHSDGSFTLRSNGILVNKAEPGTDIRALLDNYISVGTVRCAALGYSSISV